MGCVQLDRLRTTPRRVPYVFDYMYLCVFVCVYVCEYICVFVCAYNRRLCHYYVFGIWRSVNWPANLPGGQAVGWPEGG